MPVRIRLSDPDLFGNDVAEDEPEEVFRSYALHRSEVGQFSDAGTRYRIARAYKGEGKSALLRLAQQGVLASQGPDTLIVASTGSSLMAASDSSDFAHWLRSWKSAIFARIGHEIGARIGFAWTDDEISLVEEAEKQGFRSRGLVSSIFERFRKPSVDVAGAKVGFELTKPGVAAAEGVVRRWARERSPIWIVIDDVDQNFQNDAAHKAKVAAFFVACRELTNLVPEFRIRAAVRPNVWTTLKMEYEALSHVEQYVHDLTWSQDDMRRLLASRIEGYLRRHGQWESAEPIVQEGQERDRALINFVFEDPMRWSGRDRPPSVVLYTLSKHRPRWVIELSKVAAARAQERGSAAITRADILHDLGAFGSRRIEDTIAEFRSQCPEIEELVTAFGREREQMSTQELVSVIDRKILNHLQPKISGVVGNARAMDVAAFLFQIGFIFGRRDYQDASYDHVTYAERPGLLRSRSDMDAGLSWEIHPVFRQVLEIRDAAGKELRRPGDIRGRGRG